METKRKKLTNGSVNTYSLPLDLMMEVLKRLPLKTLIRSLCVSKLWASIIRGRYFMKLFLNESLTRPRGLVFAFRKIYDGLAFSEVRLKNAHEVSSSSSLATYHVTFHTRPLTNISTSVHGLICYGSASELMVYNPCTRRSVTLPKVNAGKRAINRYIGYDPINNDYKVLCIVKGISKLRNRRSLAEEIQVLTLGSTLEHSWRMIQDNTTIPPHSPVSQELCFNGVLYYRAFTGTNLNDSAIMSFDVRSENFDLIKGPCKFPSYSKLTSYEGKPAVIFFEKKIDGIIGLWVLQDPCKEEWSKKTFVLPPVLRKTMHFHRFQRFRTTDTDTAEIIFTPLTVHRSLLSAVYFDLKNNSVRYFSTEGTTDVHDNSHPYSVSACQVENLMFL